MNISINELKGRKVSEVIAIEKIYSVLPLNITQEEKKDTNFAEQLVEDLE